MSIAPLRDRPAFKALVSTSTPVLGHDSSTNVLIDRYRTLKG